MAANHMNELEKSYQILNLEPGVSLAEIKQAYRDLVRVWHPDRFGHDERLRSVAQEKLKEINGAYELLQAHFFESAINPQETPPPESEPTPETATPTTSPPVRQNRVALWAALGVIAVVAITTAATLFLRSSHKTAAKSESVRTSTPRKITTYALSFSRNQGHLAIAATGSLTGTFTVECWALTRKPRLTQTILSSRGPDDFGFDIKFRQGKMFHAGIGDGSRWLEAEANAVYSYTKEAWYHIAYVVTPTNYAAYINGEPTATGVLMPAGNAVLYDEKHHLRLGADGLSSEDLEGNIAEVRIWNMARTQEEIVADRKTELAGDEPGLRGYWRFAQTNSSMVADLSGHGLTGTLNGIVTLNTNGPPIATP
jgi:hypothetical protein